MNKLFQLCNIKQDSSPPILNKSDKDPGSQTSLAIASDWLRDCLENHDSCNPPPEFRWPPKRLINVGNETQKPFMVEIPLGSSRLRWVSLSYCWGDQPALKLTPETMEMLRSGISLDRFDPTIRDAILITRALGITYIWIDALCIIQDDSSRDWDEQASKMVEIYGGSTMTLVASSSNSVKNGFLKERDLQYIPVLSSSNLAIGSASARPPARLFVSAEWNKNKDGLNGPWSDRGWTMQEGLLPNRLLCYTEHQMTWKCCEEERFERGVTKHLHDEVARILTYSDDIAFGSGWLWNLGTFMKFKRFPDYIPSNLDYPLLSDPETFRLWYDLIQEYTQKRFTHINDRLVAISGLAKIFGNTIRSDEYVAGLWKADLIRGLMWHVNGARLISRQSPDDVQAIHNAFPSWSWASVGYELVENSHKESNAFRVLSVVEDVQIDLVDQRHPFGAVKSGSVTVTGPLKKLPRLYYKEWKSAESSISEFERRLSEIVAKESLGGVEHKYCSPPGGHFAALQMLEDIDSLNLIVLEATGEVSSGNNVYRRVGVLTCRYFPEECVASSSLMARLEEINNSRATRLGPKEKSAKLQTASNDIVMELREQWRPETVIIV